jgi:multicomponent Na+:H+ antiporter subunit C|tara:strand:- start:956 stop:1303 length:348 start_codon:yes stop_codon:yes gene_type:complete
MSMNFSTLVLLPAILLLIIGCFGILNSKSIINSLFSLDVIDTATISIFVLIAATSGSQTPILSDAPRYANYSDPYPQAIILTAIVIGFATQSLLCTVALRLSRSNPLLKYEDLEK